LPPKEKLKIVIGAAPPHFQNFAGAFPRPALFAKRAGRNAFGLIQEYSTSKEFASGFGSPRLARRPNCIEFWAKKSVGDFARGKENFLIKSI